MFTCLECGGNVRPLAKSGRTRVFARGVVLPIPEDFAVPTCDTCDEIYINKELGEKLDAVLQGECLRLQGEHYNTLIASITAHDENIKHHDIARACGVTPAFLSNALAGRKQASPTLTRLLEAFAVCPSELFRNLAGRPWHDGLGPILKIRTQSSSERTAASASVKHIYSAPMTPKQHAPKQHAKKQDKGSPDYKPLGEVAA
ncbi:hypothetical protein WME94_45430 [Sorangium sp. So ce429]